MAIILQAHLANFSKRIKMTTTDYSTYNASKLRHALNSTRKQIAKFENEIFKADKQLRAFSAKREAYLQKEALICKELSLKLPIPNDETRNILENDEIDGVWETHKDFMKSLKNEE